MKAYPLAGPFDGAKLAARYGLKTTDGSFFIGGDGLIHVPDNLPDDPPVFEAPDPPVVTKTLEQRVIELETDVKGIKDGTIKPTK